MESSTSQIGFASNLVPLVISGEKVLTYRLGGRWNYLKAGDVVETKDSDSGKPFGKLEILEKKEVTFGELPIDTEGHETYINKEAQREIFETYYQQPIQDSEPVTILKFNVVELTN